MFPAPATADTPPVRSATRSPLDRPLTAFAVLVLLALLIRITLGVDLSDEAYYATYLDAWRKTGLPGGASRVLHGTAALLVYPLAAAFQAAMGGTGLILFLRGIYVLLSLLAAAATYAFMVTQRDRQVAILVALLVLAFIPFSLPAPSYNTIGMLGLLSGLMLTGRLLVLPPASGVRGFVRLLLPALAWTVTSIAYPTLGLVGPVFLLSLLLAFGPERRGLVWRLGLLSILLHVVGAAAVVGALGTDRLLESVRFTRVSLGAYSGLAAKWALTLTLFRPHPAYMAALVAMAILGGALATVGRLRHWAAALALLLAAGLLPLSRLDTPTLFVHAHDLVLLLAVLGLLTVVLPGPGGPPRLVRLMTAAGLLGGMATVASATNGFYNFAVGGFGAAVLGAAFCAPAGSSALIGAAHRVLLAIAILTIGAGSGFYLYGEARNPLAGPSIRVTSGAFAGLLTTPEQHRFITEATRLLAEHAPPRGRVTMLGSLPGTYLLTPMAPTTLSTWNYSQHLGPLLELEALTDAFFADPANRPDVIGVDSSTWTRPPTPAETRLLSGYVLAEQIRVGPRGFAVYVPALR